MHCYICDRVDDLIQFDKAEQEYGPCTTCLAVIQETLNGYEDLNEDVLEDEA